ncbi:hypothetical protein [Arthrobacter sp. CG_A4]|uniref:hypothetical protein n=1 Tax=Arthrobacter sp. CG_A4 TaxID=3071706 RepID=UPI002E125E8D
MQVRYQLRHSPELLVKNRFPGSNQISLIHIVRWRESTRHAVQRRGRTCLPALVNDQAYLPSDVGSGRYVSIEE